MDEQRTTPEEVITEVVVDTTPVDTSYVVHEQVQENDVTDEVIESSTSTAERTPQTSANLSAEDVRSVVSSALADYARQQETGFEDLGRQLDEVRDGLVLLSADTSDADSGEDDHEDAKADDSQVTTGYALDQTQWAVIHDGVRVVATCAVFQLVMVAALGGLVAWSIVSGGWRHG